MQVHATTAKELPARLAALREELGIRRVSSTFEPLPGDPKLYEVDAGITDAVCAFAESGTIVVTSGPQRNRGTWLIPPIHICVLRASQILPDLLDWKPAALPTSLTFITGPSKTADIEGILITGVHGPRAVHIFLTEDS